MNICLVCNEYPPAKHGGIGTMTRDLAEGLVNQGYSVIVVGIYNPFLQIKEMKTLELINGVCIFRFPSAVWIKEPRLRMIVDRLRLAHEIKKLHLRYHFDLIECPDDSGWLAIGDLPSIPKIVRLHGSQLYFNKELDRKTGRLNVIFEKLWLRRADYWISVSIYVAEKTLNETKLKKNYKVIYNSIDTKRFYPDKSTQTDKGLIIFTGSIIPKKGVEELIQAFVYVVNEIPYAHLLLIGKDLRIMPDGRKYSDFLYSLLPTEIWSKVEFLGWCENEELPNTLRKAEVCCFPSHAEAFAIAPLEAMSVGVPVVFMNTGSGPEAIEDKESGLLCNTRDPKDISEKIIRILKDPELAMNIGSIANQRVTQLFNKETWLLENISCYKDFLVANNQINL